MSRLIIQCVYRSKYFLVKIPRIPIVEGKVLLVASFPTKRWYRFVVIVFGMFLSFVAGFYVLAELTDDHVYSCNDAVAVSRRKNANTVSYLN